MPQGSGARLHLHPCPARSRPPCPGRHHYHHLSPCQSPGLAAPAELTHWVWTCAACVVRPSEAAQAGGCAQAAAPPAPLRAVLLLWPGNGEAELEVGSSPAPGAQQEGWGCKAGMRRSCREYIEGGRGLRLHDDIAANPTIITAIITIMHGSIYVVPCTHPLCTSPLSSPPIPPLAAMFCSLRPAPYVAPSLQC
eukprot:scaffold33212_cov18-Tisochrysis_lutea.AAC.2